MHHAPPHGNASAGGPSAPTTVDPVCGMSVSASEPRGGTFSHQGVTYGFCSAGCRTKFSATPEVFLARMQQKAAQAAACCGTSGAAKAGYAKPESPAHDTALASPAPKRLSKATRYICPMHPEVVRNGPDFCPECGMALEPEDGSLPEDDAELSDMQRRLIPAVLLSLPLLWVAMGPMLPFAPAAWFPSEQTSGFIQAALASPVVLWVGAPFFARALISLKNLRANMFTLIALGSGAAFLFSWLLLLFPEALPHLHGAHALYFEAAAVIITLTVVGQVLELRARKQTSSAIRGLLDLSPKLARRIEGDASGANGESEHDVPVSEVRVGDRLRVRPGERIPTDGSVLEGLSHVDEAMVTGEPVPVEKSQGSALIGGTLNGAGGLVMRAERVGEDTFLAQIVRLVTAARQSRAQVQHIADRVSAWLVPLVVLIACLTAVAWLFWGPEPSALYALSSAVSVLIIACPCALGLATPMSLTVGLGRGATLGVLIKDADALERLANVDTLVVDKTGTLTQGKPALVHVEPAQGFEENRLLTLAASVERSSEHPLAEAIVAYTQQRELTIAAVEDFDARFGRGVLGRIAQKRVAVGNLELMRELDVAPHPALEARAEALRNQGQSVLFCAQDAALIGLLGLRDPIKESALEAVRALHREGIRIVMATGDHPTSAAHVARELGIDEVAAAQLPADKLRLIERLKREGHSVAMAGDGVNDAPALSGADVGIAMSTGSDIALESAQITLLHGDLGGLQKARSLARATLRNIRQNLGFAFLYNLLGVPLAAGVLYPAFGLLLHPMLASLAMSLSSISVIANALRLRSQKL